MSKCKDCIHYQVCHAVNIDAPCVAFKNKADFVKVESVSEQIIRKNAEVSDYWKKDVKKYRAMQGYSNIEHDADNFLRGYNEAVEDILAILDGEKKGETK